MKPIKAILIDAEARTIEHVTIDADADTLQQYYALLKCELVTAIGFENGDTGWCDDEGLLNSPTAFLYLPSMYPQPLATRLLITGTDWNDEGDVLVDARSDIAAIKADIQFHFRLSLKMAIDLGLIPKF